MFGKGAGIGIYDFDLHNIIYAGSRLKLNAITDKKNVALGELKQGEQYNIYNHIDKSDKLYKFRSINTDNVKGRIYNFHRPHQVYKEESILIDDTNAHLYSIYKKGFIKRELSISLNAWHFTMHIEHKQYRNLINISKDGSVTVDKRIK